MQILTAICKIWPRPRTPPLIFGSLSLSCFLVMPLSSDDFCVADMSRAKRPIGFRSFDSWLLILCTKKHRSAVESIKFPFNKSQLFIVNFCPLNFWRETEIFLFRKIKSMKKNIRLINSNHVACLFKVNWIVVFVAIQDERALPLWFRLRMSVVVINVCEKCRLPQFKCVCVRAFLAYTVLANASPNSKTPRDCAEHSRTNTL